MSPKNPPEEKRTGHEPPCPSCGGRIQAVTTRGPNSHVIQPCGHTVPPQSTVEALTGEQGDGLRADGSGKPSPEESESGVQWTELPEDLKFETDVEFDYDTLREKLNPFTNKETETHTVTEYIPFALPKMAFYACECGEHSFSGPAPPHITEELDDAQADAVERGEYEEWMLDRAGVPERNRGGA